MTKFREQDGVSTQQVCHVCGNRLGEELLTLENIPVFSNFLADTPEQAKTAVLGNQKLAQCGRCGFVFNSAFEPEKLRYGEGYHAERGVSAVYRRHIDRTLDFIESAERLEGKTVLEAACGTGEFLRAAARRNPQCCIGVDPSAEEGREGNLTIRQTLFDREYLEKYPQKIDILINRHMIEHIQAPLEMLRLFAQSLPQGGLLYLETPRLDWILQNRVFYDFPYEHCSYYSDDFMPRLLKAAGFSIAAMESSYDGQYFSVCARKSGEPSEIENADIQQLKDVQGGFEAAARALRGIAKGGSECQYGTLQNSTVLQSHLFNANGIYLWGAAAKGVMCSNLLRKFKISGCIDSNPYKQGKFIPGTGYPVLAPKEISFDRVKCVLVENDVYFDEIQEEVREIDLRIQVLRLNQLLGIGH